MTYTFLIQGDIVGKFPHPPASPSLGNPADNPGKSQVYRAVASLTSPCAGLLVSPFLALAFLFNMAQNYSKPTDLRSLLLVQGSLCTSL